MGPFEYVRAGNVAAAVALVSADPQAQYLAGGTTQLDLMLKDGVIAPERLVAGGDRRDAEQGLRPERHVGLRVDELQAVVFSEVLEILDVEGGQREPVR
jgi:FAD binding domain in molybdopterin dehydrogenase